MNTTNHINYVEFAAHDLDKSRAFFQAAFGWEFESYGDDYYAFSNAGLEGGFYHAEKSCSAEQGSALVVLYSDTLEETAKEIEKAGGEIIVPIFSFPGGRRFHFKEPCGNELAVWSDK